MEVISGAERIKGILGGYPFPTFRSKCLGFDSDSRPTAHVVLPQISSAQTVLQAPYQMPGDNKGTPGMASSSKSAVRSWLGGGRGAVGSPPLFVLQVKREGP